MNISRTDSILRLLDAPQPGARVCWWMSTNVNQIMLLPLRASANLSCPVLPWVAYLTTSLVHIRLDCLSDFFTGDVRARFLMIPFLSLILSSPGVLLFLVLLTILLETMLPRLCGSATKCSAPWTVDPEWTVYTEVLYFNLFLTANMEGNHRLGESRVCGPSKRGRRTPSATYLKVGALATVGCPRWSGPLLDSISTT